MTLATPPTTHNGFLIFILKIFYVQVCSMKCPIVCFDQNSQNKLTADCWLLTVDRESFFRKSSPRRHVVTREVTEATMSQNESDESQTRNRYWRCDRVHLHCLRADRVTSTPSLCSFSPTTSASLHSDRVSVWKWQRVIDSSTLTFTSPHNSNISTVTTPSNHFFFARPPLHCWCLCLSLAVGDAKGDDKADRIVFWLDIGCRQSGTWFMRFARHNKYVSTCCLFVCLFGWEAEDNLILFRFAVVAHLKKSIYFQSPSLNRHPNSFHKILWTRFNFILISPSWHLRHHRQHIMAF